MHPCPHLLHPCVCASAPAPPEPSVTRQSTISPPPLPAPLKPTGEEEGEAPRSPGNNTNSLTPESQADKRSTALLAPLIPSTCQLLPSAGTGCNGKVGRETGREVWRSIRDMTVGSRALGDTELRGGEKRWRTTGTWTGWRGGIEPNS